MFFIQSDIFAKVNILLIILPYILFFKETHYMFFNSKSRLPHNLEPLRKKLLAKYR